MNGLLKFVFIILLASREYIDHPSYSMLLAVKQRCWAFVRQFSLAGRVVKIKTKIAVYNLGCSCDFIFAKNPDVMLGTC